MKVEHLRKGAHLKHLLDFSLFQLQVLTCYIPIVLSNCWVQLSFVDVFIHLFEPSISSDAPVHFSSDDIKNYPEIIYREQEAAVPVTLLCKFEILRGIAGWRNVTYKIEWLVDGQLIKKPSIICKPANGLKENELPCPNINSVTDELIGKGEATPHGYYKAGQTVCW